MSTFLPKNRTSFYTRIVIPKKLRLFFNGRRELWRSLGPDREQADYMGLQYEASAHRLFRLLRKKSLSMTNHQIEALITRWLTDALDEAEDDRALGGPYTDAALEDISMGLSEAMDFTHEALLAGNTLNVAVEANEMLQEAGLPAMDHTDPAFKKLCRRLLRAKLEFFRIESDRWDGKYSERPTVSLAMPAKEPVKPSPAFGQILDKYLLANPRPARTANPLRAEVGRFLEAIGGDRPIAVITRQDVVRYKESLQERGAKLVTQNKHLTNLEAIFKWSTTHGYLPDGLVSPARGLAPSKRQARKQAQDRRPFTDTELLRLFSSPKFQAQRTEHPERYWLVLMLLFQICRREEAAQLYLKDLGEENDIPYMLITDAEQGQSVKNAGSRRKVPLHSSLIQLGFLDYVETVKRTGQKRLFYQLARKGTSGYGDPVGKWFGRFVTSLGMTDPSLVIHSLRHGGITKLHNAGVSGNLAEMIVGHSAGNVHGRYVHRELISMRTLRDALEELRYPVVVEVLLKQE